MPFINSKVNFKVSEEQKNEIKSQLGKAIEIIPGKTEAWLMIGIEDDCILYFKGDNSSKLVFIEVKVFGKSQKSDYDKLTAKLCEIFEKILGILPSNIYIKYEETDYWGWNGSNF